MKWKIAKFSLSMAALVCLFSYGVSAQGNRHTFSAPRLGTVAKLTYFSQNDFDHHSLERDFLQLVDSFNQIFSDYDPHSEVNRLCQHKARQFVVVSEPLFHLIKEANLIANASKGKFDITIGALSKLWRQALQQGNVPRQKLIRRAKRRVDYRLIKLNSVNQQIRLKKNGMQLDFGGIAKGYIADQLANFLRSRKINQFLIDLGGDLTMGDPPPNSDGWTVAIEWASKTIQLSNMSVATSGPDYQFFVHRGKRYSHIIDPDTGWGIAEPFNTTIISKEGWMSDALASVGALVPPEETLKLLWTLNDVDGVMQRSGQIFQSNGFIKYVLANSKN